MASGSNGLAVAASSTSTTTEGVGAPAKAGSSGVESLPKEMQDMKIKDDKIDHSDDKELEATVVDGNGTETGHIIATTIGGRNGQPKQTISYSAERVVGTGSFGIVFQVSCSFLFCPLCLMPANIITDSSCCFWKCTWKCDRNSGHRFLYVIFAEDYNMLIYTHHCELMKSVGKEGFHSSLFTERT
jgi:hypothetical protein